MNDLSDISIFCWNLRREVLFHVSAVEQMSEKELISIENEPIDD